MAFDAEQALRDPGFTPGAAHAAPLFELLRTSDDDGAERLERILSRAPELALRHAGSAWDSAEAKYRARLTRLVARLDTGNPKVVAFLNTALADPEPLTKRYAVRGLGKLEEPSPETEQALLMSASDADLPLRRALADAIGKVGSSKATPTLEAWAGDPDAELSRRAKRGLLILERRLGRTVPSAIALDVRLPEEYRVTVRTRAGLSRIAADELRSLGKSTVNSSETVELFFGGSLAELLVARTALSFSLEVPPSHGVERSEAGLARLLSSEVSLAALRAWTEGAIKYRLILDGERGRGHLWKVVEHLAKSCPELVNDPRQATWEISVPENFEKRGLSLIPRGFDDPRFDYRERDVRAASHPTIAAALAHVAGAQPGDVVWDPFVGSGLELVERARLGPYTKLYGSDLEASALSAAKVNLERAGIERFELIQADALRITPEGVNLIVTNPPMGRRVARDGSVAELLRHFLGHAARVLIRDGRLIWLSPLPNLAVNARAFGFSIDAITTVDMGGFPAELQVLRLVTKKS